MGKAKFLSQVAGPEEHNGDPEEGGVDEVAGADLGNEVGRESGRGREEKRDPDDMLPLER